MRVVAGEGAVLEDRIGEEIGRRHRDNQAVVLQRLLEILDDLIALRRGVDRDQVVVVKVDAIGADFAEQIADLRRRELLAHRPAERVAADVADRPEAEGEFQLGIKGRSRHKLFLLVLN